MACAVPKAGGVFDYAQLGLGKFWAYVSGAAQVLEFLFAPPALAMAVGAYLAPILPESLGIGPKPLAIAALGLVTILNVRGIKQAAAFELSIAIVASLGLLLFAWLVAPAFEIENYLANPWPNGWFGVFQAVPFAIWFYLGIEGVANVAEESHNPTRRHSARLRRGLVHSDRAGGRRDGAERRCGWLGAGRFRQIGPERVGRYGVGRRRWGGQVR